MSSVCLPTPTTAAVTLQSPSQLSAPIPSAFVTRNGTRLELNGDDFVAVGPNAYWLALDENIERYPTIPSRGRVLELMSIASAMGANTVRAHTVGVNVGTDRSTENALGQFSERGFAAVDWAVYAARSYGLRLIVPLTDQYDYYHGGIPTFLRWRGLTADSPSDYGPFYDLNSDVYADFVQYVTTLLTRPSNITGLTLAEEPTVLAFETGNELGGWGGKSHPPPVEWTRSIAQLLKRLAPNHLVISGTYGVKKEELAIDEVDVVSDHYYPTYNYNLRQAADRAQNGGKVFIAGEFDWTDKWYKPELYAIVAAPAVLAALIWLLPGRWWPWHISLGCCCCRQRRKRKRKGYRGVGSAAGAAETDVRPSLQAGNSSFNGKHALSQSTTSLTVPYADSYPPRVAAEDSPSRSILDRSFALRRWHLSLLILLLCAPLGAVVHVFMPNPLSSFLSQLESLSAEGKVAGSFYWSLFGRDDSCCGYVQHNDGYTLHYPSDPTVSGSAQGSGDRVATLARHAWRMRSERPPWLDSSLSVEKMGLSELPAVVCPQDNLTLPTNASWTGGLGGTGTEPV